MGQGELLVSSYPSNNGTHTCPQLRLQLLASPASLCSAASVAGPQSQYFEGERVEERAGGKPLGESKWGDAWAFRPQTWVGEWQEQCTAREQSGRQDTQVVESWVVCLLNELPSEEQPCKCHSADFRSCLTCFCPSPLFSADSTGTHSLYTTYKDYEVMFHVSTMLPYMPNNRQQVGPASAFQIWAQPADGLRALRIGKASRGGGVVFGVFFNSMNNFWLFSSFGSSCPLKGRLFP